MSFCLNKMNGYSTNLSFQNYIMDAVMVPLLDKRGAYVLGMFRLPSDMF